MASLCTLLSVVAALLARRKSSFLCVRKFGVNTCLVEFKTEAVIQPNGRAVSVTPITLPSLAGDVCVPQVCLHHGGSPLCVFVRVRSPLSLVLLLGGSPHHMSRASFSVRKFLLNVPPGFCVGTVAIPDPS